MVVCGLRTRASHPLRLAPAHAQAVWVIVGRGRAGHRLKLEALTVRPLGVDALGLDTGDGSEYATHTHYRNRTSLYGAGVAGWRNGQPRARAGS